MRFRGLAWWTAFVLVGSLGCNSASKRDLTLLRAGEDAFRQREYQRAVARSSEFLAGDSSSPEAARALYLRGMARAMTGERAPAYVDLLAVCERAQESDLAWRAAAALGAMYFEDENWAAAVGFLDRALRSMPGSAARDVYLFRLGLSLERLGRWTDAQRPFSEIAQNYRQGPFGERAARRLRLKPREFAVQAGVFNRRENADARIRELSGLGERSRPLRESRPAGEVYVVLFGGYATYAEAISALARVRGIVPDATLWP